MALHIGGVRVPARGLSMQARFPVGRGDDRSLRDDDRFNIVGKVRVQALFGKRFVVPAGALPVPVSERAITARIGVAGFSGSCRPKLRQYRSKPGTQLLPISPGA